MAEPDPAQTPAGEAETPKKKVSASLVGVCILATSVAAVSLPDSYLCLPSLVTIPPTKHDHCMALHCHGAGWVPTTTVWHGIGREEEEDTQGGRRDAEEAVRNAVGFGGCRR